MRSAVGGDNRIPFDFDFTRFENGIERLRVFRYVVAHAEGRRQFDVFSLHGFGQ